MEERHAAAASSIFFASAFRPSASRREETADRLRTAILSRDAASARLLAISPSASGSMEEASRSLLAASCLFAASCCLNLIASEECFLPALSRVEIRASLARATFASSMDSSSPSLQGLAKPVAPVP